MKALYIIILALLLSGCYTGLEVTTRTTPFQAPLYYGWYGSSYWGWYDWNYHPYFYRPGVYLGIRYKPWGHNSRHPHIVVDNTRTAQNNTIPSINRRELSGTRRRMDRR